MPTPIALPLEALELHLVLWPFRLGALIIFRLFSIVA